MTSKTILIIEDELIIAKTFAKYLSTKGYHSIFAIHFDQAKTQLETHKIDLILIDIHLKKSINGIEIAHYINENYGIPFIFVTSNIGSDTIEKAKATSPKGYITKPVNKETLFTTMEMINLNKIENSGVLKFKDGKNLYHILQKDILYIQSNHVYVKIFVEHVSQPYLVRNSLQNIYSLLNKNSFIQVHRGYIVNVNKVNVYNNNELTIRDIKLPISNSRKEIVHSALENIYIP